MGRSGLKEETERRKQALARPSLESRRIGKGGQRLCGDQFGKVKVGWNGHCHHLSCGGCPGCCFVRTRNGTGCLSAMVRHICNSNSPVRAVVPAASCQLLAASRSAEEEGSRFLLWTADAQEAKKEELVWSGLVWHGHTLRQGVLEELQKSVHCSSVGCDVFGWYNTDRATVYRFRRVLHPKVIQGMPMKARGQQQPAPSCVLRQRGGWLTRSHKPCSAAQTGPQQSVLHRK